MESFQSGTTPEKATEVQILKDKMSAVKKVEFFESSTEQEVFGSLKKLAAKIDQISMLFIFTFFFFLLTFC